MVTQYTSSRTVFGFVVKLASVSLNAKYFAHVICAAISAMTGQLNVTFPLTIAVLLIGWPSKMYGRAGKRSKHISISISIFNLEFDKDTRYRLLFS